MRKARYIDLANEVTEAIRCGNLLPGARMPTHRMFAKRHGIALATATRVYRELERRRLVVGEAGRGVYVRDTTLPTTLGVEQAVADGLIDLVFNMPGDAGDVDLLRTGLKRLATSGDLEAMLRYQPHGGRPHERRIIADYLSRSLGTLPTDRLLITSGAQHGLSLFTFGLLKPGNTIGADPLTYPGIKAVAEFHDVSLEPIEGEKGCMDPEMLARRCQDGDLQAVYLMPTVQNPLGAVIDEQRRLELIRVARRYELLIIEDSAYAFLEPDQPPSLLELAPERTIHIGGFSKSVATGLRLGYLIAPEHHSDRLTRAIRATTWNTPALISALVVEWIKQGTVAASEERRRQEGGESQRLCREIFHELPLISHRNASFTWLPLEGGQRAQPIVSQLKSQGIAVSPSEPFSTTAAAPQALRLAFGGVPRGALRNALERVRDEIETALLA